MPDTARCFEARNQIDNFFGFYAGATTDALCTAFFCFDELWLLSLGLRHGLNHGFNSNQRLVVDAGAIG